MIRYLNIGFLCGLLFAFTASGVNAEQIGIALEVKNKVTGLVSKTKRRIHRGDGVFMNEFISTGALSRAELQFLDKTLLTIGAKSTVLLDIFVYNPDDRSGKIVINTLKGAFRFVSGSALKSAYRIKTPLATIGVRGTVIDGYADATGKFSVFILHKGEMEVCSSNMCRVVKKADNCVVVRANGQISQPEARRSCIRNLSFLTPFPIGFGRFYINPQHFNENNGRGLGAVGGNGGGGGVQGNTGDPSSNNNY